MVVPTSEATNEVAHSAVASSVVDEVVISNEGEVERLEPAMHLVIWAAAVALASLGAAQVDVVVR